MISNNQIKEIIKAKNGNVVDAVVDNSKYEMDSSVSFIKVFLKRIKDESKKDVNFVYTFTRKGESKKVNQFKELSIMLDVLYSFSKSKGKDLDSIDYDVLNSFAKYAIKTSQNRHLEVYASEIHSRFNNKLRNHLGQTQILGVRSLRGAPLQNYYLNKNEYGGYSLTKVVNGEVSKLNMAQSVVNLIANFSDDVYLLSNINMINLDTFDKKHIIENFANNSGYNLIEAKESELGTMVYFAKEGTQTVAKTHTEKHLIILFWFLDKHGEVNAMNSTSISKTLATRITDTIEVLDQKGEINGK